MRTSGLLILAICLGACSQSDQEKAKAQAEQAKQEARKAFRQAEIEGRKASREIDHGMGEARDKFRRAVGVNPDNGQPEDNRRAKPEEHRQ